MANTYTIQVGANGYMTCLRPGQVDEDSYSIGQVIFGPAPGSVPGSGFFRLKINGGDIIFDDQSYTNIINGDTGVAFASVAALKTYIKTNFFRNATGGGGITTNALTFNNSGSGDASGSTFNGSAAKTLSYNSIGAQVALISGTNIKSINGSSILGSGDLVISMSGTAGGDLSGTYPNPTVNTINGISKSFYDPSSSIQTQLNGKSPSAGSSSIVTVGTLTTGSIPYSILTGIPTIPVGANPSGTIGLTANNGVATTFMRSDATPALGITITPSWTGAHIWTEATVSTTLNPLIQLTNTQASTGSTDLFSPSIRLRTQYFNTTDKTSDFFITNEGNSTSTVAQLLFAYSLAGAAPTTLLSIDRFGNFNCKGSGINFTVTNGNLNLGTAGNKILIATGTNASVNTVTLVAGTITVANTAVTANSKIFVKYNTPAGTLASGLSTPDASRIAGTSFVINSVTTAGAVNIADTSTVDYWIIN